MVWGPSLIIPFYPPIRKEPHPQPVPHQMGQTDRFHKIDVAL